MYTILICLLAIHLHAVDYTPLYATPSAPVAEMQSVNSASYMSSGSTYSGTVYTVGASEPNQAPTRSGQIRKGGPGTPSGESDYDPNNPQFSPLGDALWPMLWMILAYGIVAFIRRKKNEERTLKN